MYALYGNIYHQYTPNVSIYTIHGSYGYSTLEISKLTWRMLFQSGGTVASAKIFLFAPREMGMMFHGTAQVASMAYGL